MKMNKKGFTLGELLVVLGILVLLAGIGIPQYLKVQQRAEDALRLAKAQAAVTAFLAEVGYDVLPAEDAEPAVEGQQPEDPKPLEQLSGTSMLTGEPIDFLGGYWNEDEDGPLDDLLVDHEGKVSFDPTKRHEE
jgi:prepilin-type N-terminal cleavage/methylation domain-containing protein